MKEFELIERFFAEPGKIGRRKDVALGIGDDAAVINVPANSQLVVTTDTLVEGVHFFSDIDPRALGHRSVAVSLSDVAAMGAEPAWISIALTLPKVDRDWIEAFSAGIFEICEYYNVEVIGGDTTQGPLAVTVSAKGLVPQDKALTRSGANPGDWIYVTGTLGDAGVAIDAINDKLQPPFKYFTQLKARYEYPTPRLAVAQGLRSIASAAIDISDGLLSDIGHILKASDVGAVVNVDQLPLSDALRGSVADEAQREHYALCSGDDYELLFTVPEDKRGALEVGLAQYGVDLSCIGQIQGPQGKLELRKDNKPYPFEGEAYQHFSGDS